MTVEAKTCIELVSTDGGWHFGRCGRKATDGDYCIRHGPTRKKQRRESTCRYSLSGTLCGQPAVTVEYGDGRCAQHSNKTLVRQARLIAAAPAMLEALKAIHSWGHINGKLPKVLCERLETTIAAVEKEGAP